MRAQRHDYRSHTIELRERAPGEPSTRGTGLQLLVDDEPIGYGQLPSGLFYLDEYAYDWRKDLIDLARALVDHRSNAEQSGSRRDDGLNGE